MRVIVRQKNLVITPSLHNYIEAKILKPIRRFLKNMTGDDLPVLNLELGRVTRHHRKGLVYRAEANLSLGRRLLRVEAEGEDIRSACDILEDELAREIRTFKGRSRSVELRKIRRIKKDVRFHKAARLYRQGRIRDEGS